MDEFYPSFFILMLICESLIRLIIAATAFPALFSRIDLVSSAASSLKRYLKLPLVDEATLEAGF